MELSAFVKYQGKFFAFCDYTGIMYEIDIQKNEAYPKRILVCDYLFFIQTFRPTEMEKLHKRRNGRPSKMERFIQEV